MDGQENADAYYTAVPLDALGDDGPVAIDRLYAREERVEVPAGTELFVREADAATVANVRRRSSYDPVVVRIDPEGAPLERIGYVDHDFPGAPFPLLTSRPLSALPCASTPPAPSAYDVSGTFEAEIKPLLDELYERCRRLGLPALLHVEYYREARYGAALAWTGTLSGLFEAGRRPSALLNLATGLVHPQRRDEVYRHPMLSALVSESERAVRDELRRYLERTDTSH